MRGSIPSSPAVIAILAAFGLAMVAFVATRLDLRSDVTYFLPPGDADSVQSLVTALADSDLTRSMVVTVGARDVATARRAARTLAEQLSQDPQVRSVRDGPQADSGLQLYELYFPQRFHFVSDQPDDPRSGVAARTSDERLREMAARLKRQLALPGEGLAGALAARDPLSLFQDLLGRLRELEPGVRIEAGQFTSRSGQEAVVLLETHASPFDTRAQRPFLERLDAHFSALAAADPEARLVFESSGVHRFAVTAESQIRRDALLITAASLAGVTALFFAFFRSASLTLLSFVPVAYGVLAAACICTVLFDGLHALTLAFGASLIGVAIDYGIHLLSHHAHAPPGTPATVTLRRLRVPLALGAGTTLAGFLALALTDFPGFREMGTFSLVGVSVAAALSMLVLPSLVGVGHTPPMLSARTVGSLGRAVHRLRSYRGGLWAVPAFAVLIIATGLPRVRWTSDVRGLSRMDPEVVAQDLRVRERVSRFDTSRLVVVTGRDEEEAVARNDLVARRLGRAVAHGELEGVRSLHSLLWSTDLQHRNYELLRGDADLPRRLRAAFAAEGFRPDGLQAFLTELSRGEPPPLTLSQIRASSLASLVNGFVVDLGRGMAVLTFVRGVHSESVLAAAIDGVPGARLFDQTSLLSGVFGKFRETTVRQLAAGSLLVLLVLSARYRRWRPTLAAFAPAATSALLVMSLVGLAGVEANLLHAVSLLLVMGMGVDYGVFFVDANDDPETIGVTMLSAMLCCLTTVCSFGTLAISSHPALRAVGVTTGLGVGFSFLLAPVAWCLTGTGYAGGRGGGKTRRNSGSTAVP